MKTIDGSMGEGGGQVLRTTLVLSMLTGTPIRIQNIRSKRSRPGLMKQHLTAVQAAAEVCSARVDGASLKSTELTFIPNQIKSGDYTFSIGTAGSTTLVLQTVLPALLTTGATSHLVLEGGTHNPMAPPFEFLQRCFAPLVTQMGPQLSLNFEQYGFYPRGGGRFNVTIEPTERLLGLELIDRGALVGRQARALIAGLPQHIADRELGVVTTELGWTPDELQTVSLNSRSGFGNMLSLELVYENVVEMFVGFGEKGVRAEQVALHAVREAKAYLNSSAVVGGHLADQLLLPLAIAGRGRFTTLPLSLHARTQMELIPLFLDVSIRAEDRGGSVELTISPK